MDHIKLLEGKLSITELMDLVSSPSCGATSIFVGTTRDNFEGKVVKKLVYEAYNPMAEKALKEICGEIRSKWTVHGIAIYHRLGEVPVKEASVAIAISSEHRGESLEAVQFAIDVLKAKVPIWKKEEYEGDVEPRWKENKECTWIKSERDDDQSAYNMVSDTDDDPILEVSQDLIQVNADNNELKRRMEAFIEYKREQVNVSNIRDFCSQGDTQSSCARVDAVVVRQKDSKGHLRVRRVLNATGPQTRGIEQAQGGLPVPMIPFKKERVDPFSTDYSSSNNASSSCPPALEERLRNAEMHLGLASNRPVPKDVYARLKDLENRIMYLEGISPEYSQVLTGVPKREPRESNKPVTVKKKVYSLDELDQKIRILQQTMRESD